MLNRIILVVALLCITIQPLTAKDAKGMTVEGLFYMDMSPVDITFKDGVITNITRKEKLDGPANVYIAPGLFDNQINGYAGVSFAFAGGELTLDGIRKATKALWKDGVTTYMPTVTTNSDEVFMANLPVIADAVNDPEHYGTIPGIHVEGPYISPIDGFRGAHPKQFVRLPDWDEFSKYQKAAKGTIMQVTVAPEIDGAMDFIKQCSMNNILVALGHHNGNADQVKQAADLGAATCTHLGNGCANMINRHNNPLWPQLADDRLMISIICDGFHLRPEEIKTFWRAKGTNGTMITSDVTSYAALPPGEYKTPHGETIELTPEGLLHYPAQKVLYGSASPITKGVGHIMKVTGCSLQEAIQMASTNQANLYGLDDRGVLESGKRADIILFTIDDFKVNIKKTIVNGHVVYEQ